MPGFTTKRGYTFPVGTDDLEDGPLVIQGGMEDVDADMHLALAGVACKAYRNAALSQTSSSAWQVVPLDTEAWDSDTMHDPSINPSRLTVPAGQGGLYRVEAKLAYSNNVTGTSRNAMVRANAGGNVANGTELDRDDLPGAAGGGYVPALHMGVDWQLAAGEYVELFAYQNSGANLAYTIGQANVYLSLRRIA